MEQEQPKICPLLSAWFQESTNCKESRCAWWCPNLAGGQCALVELADKAGDIAMWAEEISGTQQAAFDRQYPRMARRGPQAHSDGKEAP